MSVSGFRFEGLTLTVESIERSLEFYGKRLGLTVEVNAAPDFAMIRIGGARGGTIGFLSSSRAKSDGAEVTTALQKRSIHVEFSTDDLDGQYVQLQSRGVIFHEAPHDEPWERSMTALDPDGYAVEFAQGRRGGNAIEYRAASTQYFSTLSPAERHRFSPLELVSANPPMKRLCGMKMTVAVGAVVSIANTTF